MMQEKFIEFAMGTLLVLISLLQFWLLGMRIDFPIDHLIG